MYIKRENAINKIAIELSEVDIYSLPKDGIIIGLTNDLKNIPSEDVVEVVRCKDCKWYKDFDGCFFSTAECEPEHFCSWGRKEREMKEAIWREDALVAIRLKYASADDELTDNALSELHNEVSAIPSADVVEREQVEKAVEGLVKIIKNKD